MTSQSRPEQQQPEFAMVLRGYDRDQVDDYVERLDSWVREWRERAAAAEASAAAAQQQAAALRRQVNRLEERTFTSTPESIEALGERVGNILKAAFEAAEGMRSEASEEAGRIKLSAAQEADQLKKAAAQEAEQRRADAQRSVAQLRKQADDLRKTAAAKVEVESKALLEKAQREAKELTESARARVGEMVVQAETQRAALESEIRGLVQRRDAVVRHLTSLQQALSGVLGGNQDPTADAAAVVVDLREAQEVAEAGLAEVAQAEAARTSEPGEVPARDEPTTAVRAAG